MADPCKLEDYNTSNKSFMQETDLYEWDGSARRSTANKRERQRMHQLNKAYMHLKERLPWIPADTKLTKLEILVFAAQYIKHLTKQLQ